MLPAAPQPFADALAAARRRGQLPTDLSSAELDALDAAVRERSVFSARTTEAAYLEEVAALVDQLLSPENRPPGEGINEATARARLQDALERLGYTPDAGFPGQPGRVPPAERGSLRDLSSDRRLKLLLETQVRQMAAIGYRLQGDTPAARDAFPCLELVRIYPRKERRNWPLRWGRAGGAMHDGRLVALKDDDVWHRLGSTDLFPDGLGQAYPPFAWGSGMGVRQVPREEAVALGAITEDETPGAVDTDVAGAADPNLGAVSRADLDAALAELDAAPGTGGGNPRLANRHALSDDATVARMLANHLVVDALTLANAGNHAGAVKGWSSRRGRHAAQAARRLARRGREMAKRVIREKRDATSAMHLPGVGRVDFIHGTPGHWAPVKEGKDKGRTHTDGYGLSHILAKHGTRALLNMPHVLAHGRVGPHEKDPHKRIVESSRGLAVIKRAGHGRAYVLTSYDPHAPNLGKPDRRERQIPNRAPAPASGQKDGPASLTLNRPGEEGGNEVANLCPTHPDSLVCAVGAGASKTSNLASQEGKATP